jgi:pimeloyl-ACP methyl ester carboxylesterase
VPSAQPHRFLAPDGVEVAAFDFGGAGPDVVFAHATGYHAMVWQPVVQHLRDSFRCVAFDTRGHGDSSKAPGADYAWANLTIDLATVVDGFGLRRPFGVGHSCGGALLLMLEEAAPGTFRSLYCFEPVVVPSDLAPLREAGVGSGAAVGANPMAENARRRRAVFASRQEAFDNYAGKPMYEHCRPEALWAYVDHGFADRPDGSVELKCRPADEARVFSMGMQSRAFDQLGTVQCPVILARGEDSGFPFDEATQAAVARPLAHARMDTLPRLTHLGPLEEPDLLARRIRAAFAAG